MNKTPKKNPAEMNFLDHLDELRGSLWRALVGIILGAAVCYYFAPIFQSWLLIPFEDQATSSLALLAPTEGFVTRLKISLVAGLLLSAPWVFLQMWLFVAPGLFSHERKLVLPVVFFSSLLFLTGSAFSLYVLPYATTFFLSFATQDIQNAWSLGKYVDFVLRLMLAFGVVFELPLLIYFLARFGVVTPAFLRQYRRHMIIAFLLLAALITPPDIFTQVVLTVPMVILYEASILLAVVAKRQYERKHQEFMEGGEEDNEATDSEDEPEHPGRRNPFAAGEEDYSDLEDSVNDVPRDPSDYPWVHKQEAGETTGEEKQRTAEDIREERLRKLREDEESASPDSPGPSPDDPDDDASETEPRK